MVKLIYLSSRNTVVEWSQYRIRVVLCHIECGLMWHMKHFLWTMLIN